MAQIEWNLIEYGHQFSPPCADQFHDKYKTARKKSINVICELGNFLWKCQNHGAYLVTIVPPVETADKNRNTQYSQKYGTYAVAMPHTN